MTPIQAIAGYRGLRGHSKSSPLSSVVSYDIEANVDLKNPTGFIDAFQQGFYDGPTGKIKVTYPAVKDIKSAMAAEATDPFHMLRKASDEALGVYVPFSGRTNTTHTLKDIRNILDKGRSVGVYNLGFEGRFLTQDPKVGGFDIPYYSSGSPSSSARRAFRNRGGLVGLTDKLAREGLELEGMLWGSLSGAHNPTTVRDKLVAHSRNIINEVSTRYKNKSKGIVFDQLAITRGFMAKMESIGFMKGLPGDYRTGTGLDVISEALGRTNLLPKGLGEFHYSGLDAALSGETSNFMASVIESDANVHPDILRALGKNIDEERYKYLGSRVSEKIKANKPFTKYEQFHTSYFLGVDEIPVTGSMRGASISSTDYIKSLNVPDEYMPHFQSGFDKGYTTTHIPPAAAGGGGGVVPPSRPIPPSASPKPSGGGGRMGGVVDKVKKGGGDIFTSGKFSGVAKVGVGAAGIAAAYYLSRMVYENTANPTTAEWGRASRYGVGDKYIWGAVAEEYSEDLDPDSESIVSHGTMSHAIIQDAIRASNPDIIAEYPILDAKYKITGHIDLVVPLDVNGKTVITPVEIKTVGLKALGSMTAPKEEHEAQAQFYLDYLARANPDAPPSSEPFLYVAREDPSQFKVFEIKRDPARFQYFINRYRGYQRAMKRKGLTPQKLTSNIEVASQVAQGAVERNLPNTGHGVSIDQLYETISNAVMSSSITPYISSRGTGVTKGMKQEDMSNVFNAMNTGNASELRKSVGHPMQSPINFNKALNTAADMVAGLNRVVESPLNKGAMEYALNVPSGVGNDLIHSVPDGLRQLEYLLRRPPTKKVNLSKLDLDIPMVPEKPKALRNPNPVKTSGLNRSNTNSFDMSSHIKAVWAKPSLHIAEGVAAGGSAGQQILAAPRSLIKTSPTKVLTTNKREITHRGHLSQRARITGRRGGRGNMRDGRPSRIGVS